LIRDEKRSEFNIWIKKKASFFKHADKDGEVVVEFHPSLSELFIMFCVLGVELCGERKNACEIAFIWWLSIERPDWLTERGRKGLDDLMPIENLQHLRSRPKSEFLNAFKIARAMRGSS